MQNLILLCSIFIECCILVFSVVCCHCCLCHCLCCCLLLCRQGLLVDRRSEPRQGERVPYVVVYGSPGLPLIQLVRRPLELLVPDSGLRLNASYYITKQLLPPLDRAFSLLGVDVREWYVRNACLDGVINCCHLLIVHLEEMNYSVAGRWRNFMRAWQFCDLLCFISCHVCLDLSPGLE